MVGGLSKLASSVGISPSFAWQIKEGVRPCPVRTAVAIEKATDGVVSRKDLRHDWKLIWPELEG